MVPFIFLSTGVDQQKFQTGTTNSIELAQSISMTSVTCFSPRYSYTATVDYELQPHESDSRLIRTLAIRLALAAVVLVLAARILG